MKYLIYTLTIISGWITAFFVWIYIQRSRLDYNSEGLYFSIEEGMTYDEDAKLVYGFFALIGLILTGIFIIIIRKMFKN